MTVLAEQLGQGAFSALATVVTASGGGWSYQARPALQTSLRGERERRHELPT